MALVLAVNPASAGRLAKVHGPFHLCADRASGNCVIDGDTIVVGGAHIRMLDYDAPEIFSPKCDSELLLGEKAKLRLLALLNSGQVKLARPQARDTDKYGRKLRLVLVDGRSVGRILIAEKLAWKWQGHRHRWCQ